MKFNIKISILLVVLLQSCWGDKGAPNYEYMPNMYESLSYETYTENEIFEDNLDFQNKVVVDWETPSQINFYNLRVINDFMIQAWFFELSSSLIRLI